ncbi:MAG: hypothetical protein R2873_21205 [Caldilineaceae bacterium]|nr:hypothetical protein [Caldilineaceae bacterium]
MRKLFQIAALGTLFFGCAAGVIHAEETTNVEVDSTETPKEENVEIPNANHRWVSSYLDLQPDYYQPTPLPLQGLAMYYNPGIMDRVLVNQLAWGDVTECDECIGRVALLREGDMDRRVWLQRPGHPAEGPFWVIDQAAKRDVPGLVRRNWAVDVDYETAMRWEMRGPIPIVVLAGPEQAMDE